MPTSLTVAAATSAPTYAVGSEPVLFLQVTNNSPTACTQDVGDPQVELVVDGASARVWGSHDCTIAPGANVVTLQPSQPVQLSITWTGLSSDPGCAAQRQRVPAGAYTLHALLSGHEGATASFSLT